jgi:uncharacterized protein YgiM (DUF1202 family)
VEKKMIEKISKKKILTMTILFVLLIAALSLAACSSGNGQNPSPGEEVPPDNAPVAVVPTAVSGGPTAQANYNTWIRGGPGENYPVYGSFLGGETTQIVGKSEDNNWWAISVPVGYNGQGWVLKNAVTASNADAVPYVVAPPLPPETNLLEPGPDDPQVTANVEVYVRSGPGTNYSAYGIAKQGAMAGVIGKSEDGTYWTVRIDPTQVGAGYGWVAVGYTTAKNTENVPVIQSPTPSTSIPVQPPATGAPTVTSIEYLNIRTGPGFQYPVIGIVPPNTSGTAVGISADGQWYAVSVPTTTDPSGQVWVSAAWVVAQNTANLPVLPAPPVPEVPEIPEPAPGAPTVTATTAVNIRSGPGTNYPSYGIAQPGAKGEAIGISEDGQWYVIKIPTTIVGDGMGWVSASYVIPENTGGLPVVPAP